MISQDILSTVSNGLTLSLILIAIWNYMREDSRLIIFNWTIVLILGDWSFILSLEELLHIFLK